MYIYIKCQHIIIHNYRIITSYNCRIDKTERMCESSKNTGIKVCLQCRYDHDT